MKYAPDNTAQLQTMFDNTNEHGICMLDSVGRILSWNKSAEHLSGYSTDFVLGKKFHLLYTKEDQLAFLPGKTIQAAYRKGNVVSEGFRVRKDGSKFWARAFLTRVKRVQAKNSFFVLIINDVTDAHALAQRRDEYVGIASHELKTPIATLSLYADLLATRLQLDRDKKSLLMLRDIQGHVIALMRAISPA